MLPQGLNPPEGPAGQAAKLRSFLWAVTFSNPSLDFKNRKILKNGGIGVRLTFAVMVLSLLGSFGFIICFSFLILDLAHWLSEKEMGRWALLAVNLLVFPASRYMIAKILVHHYKSKIKLSP